MKLKYEKATFNLSVGTGLSMESLLDLDPKERFDPDRKVDMITDYEYVVVNIFVLVRNIFSSMSTKDKARVISKDITLDMYELVKYEIEIIRSLLSGIGKDVYIMAPDYKIIDGMILKDLSKPTNNNVLLALSVRVANKFKDKEFIKTPYFKLEGTGLIFTNIPVDLLNYNKNKGLRLLESNTGKVIGHIEFNKKYRKSVLDYSTLPFTPELLTILGDSGGLLRGANPKDKRELMDILSKKRITPLSGFGLIRQILMRSNLKEWIANINTKY